MPTRCTEISILKTRYVFGQSWFVGNAPHYDACKVNRCISDSGSTLWKEVLVSRPLFTSRNLLCLFLTMDTLYMHGVEWLAVLDHSSLPEELINVQMTLQNRLGFSACILSDLYLTILLYCTNTIVPVILDFLLETKVVWLLFYFLRFTW